MAARCRTTRSAVLYRFISERNPIGAKTSLVALLRHVDGVDATVDRPKDPSGESFIDVTGPGLETQVSYRPSAGFGFFIASDTFCQRPDILIADPGAAARRVLGRLLTPIVEPASNTL